jgi:hypothetical protein
LQEPPDHLFGAARPVDGGVQLRGRLLTVGVAGLVDVFAADFFGLDELPVLAGVAQAASGELVCLSVEDQQRE